MCVHFSCILGHVNEKHSMVVDLQMVPIVLRFHIYVNIPINHAPHVPQIVVFPWQCLVCVSMATFDLQWRPGRSPEGDE